MKKRAIILLLLLLLAGLLCACGGNSPYDEYARAYEMLQQESSFATSCHEVSYYLIPATGEETTLEGLTDCQVVKTESGYDSMGYLSSSLQSNGGYYVNGEYSGEAYIRDGREYYITHDPGAPEDTRGSMACEPNFAFRMATEGVLDLPQEVIASQSAEDTDAGRLLSFTLDPEKLYSHLYGEPDSQTLFVAFREPPVYTALLDEDGRLKKVTYSFCQVSADAEPGLWQRDVQVDFLKYGDIELEFPDLNEEDYPDWDTLANQKNGG